MSTSSFSIDALSQAVADREHALDQASAATVRSADRPRQTRWNGARQVHRHPGRWLARLAANLG
jgi:hypothetical protein